MLPLLGIILGLIIGLFLDIDIPQAYSPYVAVLILAALDSLIGALLASLQKKFNTELFITGLLGNGLIAVVLSALGARLNINLNLAAIFAFGVRIINNFSQIRRFWLQQFQERRRLARQLRDTADEISSVQDYIAPASADEIITLLTDNDDTRENILEREILERSLELAQLRRERLTAADTAVSPVKEDNERDISF